MSRPSLIIGAMVRELEAVVGEPEDRAIVHFLSAYIAELETLVMVPLKRTVVNVRERRP